MDKKKRKEKKRKENVTCRVTGSATLGEVVGRQQLTHTHTHTHTNFNLIENQRI